MRYCKSNSNYIALYESIIKGNDVCLYSNNSKSKIEADFKLHTNVNIKAIEVEKGLYYLKLNRNYTISESVKNVEELLQLAYENKAVYVTVWRRTSPAAWMIHMPLVLLSRWINNKIIYTITKKENNEKQKE